MVRIEALEEYPDSKGRATVHNGTTREITIIGVHLKSGESVEVRMTRVSDELGSRTYILEPLDYGEPTNKEE
jgi:hypothetical protein